MRFRVWKFPGLLMCAALVLGFGSDLSATTRTEKDGVIYIFNPATPSRGRHVLKALEIWRAGSSGSDILLGYVSKVISDDRGNIYVLDGQLLHVLAFSPAGIHWATLGRQGDGPGEFQRPIDLLQTSDGVLGVVEGFPAKVVRFDTQGIPLPSIPVGGDGASGRGNLLEGRRAKDRLVFCGKSQELREDGFQVTEFLAGFSQDGTEEVRYLQISYLNNVIEPDFVEKDRYFVNNGRWALGSSGYLYAAPSFSEYEVHVFDTAGTLLRVIRREFASRTRSTEELAALSRGPAMMVNGRRVQVKTTVEDRDPPVKSLRVATNGDLWVLNSRGDRDQESGIFLTYDVFDPQGGFREEVSLEMAGDPRNDRVFWIDDDHLVVARTDQEDEAPDEDGPLELICYEVVP